VATYLPPGYTRANPPPRAFITEGGRSFPVQRTREGTLKPVPPRTNIQMVRQYQELHQLNPAYTWRDYLQEWSEGNIQPYSRDPGKRIPPSFREFVTIPREKQPSDAPPFGTGQLNAKRQWLIDQSAFFGQTIEEEKGQFNEVRFRSRVERMNEDQMDVWISAIQAGDYSTIWDFWARVEPVEGLQNAFYYH
jgi:hypothetical protein